VLFRGKDKSISSVVGGKWGNSDHAWWPDSILTQVIYPRRRERGILLTNFEVKLAEYKLLLAISKENNRLIRARWFFNYVKFINKNTKFLKTDII